MKHCLRSYLTQDVSRHLIGVFDLVLYFFIVPHGSSFIDTDLSKPCPHLCTLLIHAFQTTFLPILMGSVIVVLYLIGVALWTQIYQDLAKGCELHWYHQPSYAN